MQLQERDIVDKSKVRNADEGWGPPRCGDFMPDGRSRIEAVVVDELDPDARSVVEVGFSLAGLVRYRAWPCTNRRAKRVRCKAKRRERLTGGRSR